MMIAGATVAVMIIGGGIAIFLSGQASNNQVKKELTEEERALMSMNPSPAVVPGEAEKGIENDKSGQSATVAPSAASPDVLIAHAIKQLNESSLKRDNRQRSKPYCRQMAAEACIYAGDIKGANEHLAQLIIVGSSVPYYRVGPNLDLFWKAWKAGDKGAAAKLLDTSLQDVRNLPEVGRSQMELASRLAAALAAAGRIKEGLELLAEHHSSELEGQLAARVQMASDGRVAALSRRNTVLPWTRPQAVATTASLAVRGEMDAARQWALAQPTEESRVESLAEWAQQVASRQEKAGTAESNLAIVDAVKTLKPALAARVWARAGFGRYLAGDKDGAIATLKVAESLLASIAIPAEPEMPGMKAMMTYKGPDSTPLVQNATAAAELAFVYSQWPDHRPQAEAALELALSFARGLAPAWSAVGEKVAESEQAGQGLRDTIRQELALKSDDQANQSAIRYRTVLGELNTASRRRYSLQASILSRLAEAGLKEKTWAVISNRGAESNPSRRDDFFGTTLITELLEHFQGTETEKVILGAIGQTTPPSVVSIKQLMRPGVSDQAAVYVNQLDANSGFRDDIALTVATRLAATDRTADALLFTSKLDDIVLREEAYRLIAPLIAQRGHGEEVWKQVANVQQATEKASLCRGLVVGLKSGPPEKVESL